MNDNIIKTQMFHKMNVGFKGELRSHKVISVFETKLFFDIFIFLLFL